MDDASQIVDDVARLWSEGETEQVAALLTSLHPGEAAHALHELPGHLRDDVLLALPPDAAADILEALPEDMAAAAVMDMAPSAAAPLVQEMRSSEAADLLQEITPDHGEAILRYIDRQDARRARDLLQYDPDSAGGLMQTDFIAISKGMIAEDVVRQLRAHATQYAEFPAAYLYVVDDAGRLDGVVSMRALLMCESDARITTIKNPSALSAPASMSGQELVKLFRRYNYMAIPVVDDDGKLLGLVTQNDVMRFAEADADEEMLRFSGIVGGDELRDMPLVLRAWRRLSWLSINVLLNVLAASVIAYYQDTLHAVIALAVFLPIISDMSGCSGNQAVAVSIRELSLDRIRPNNFLWVLGKELSVGLLNGLALGVILGFVAWLWKGNVMLGVVVGGALWLNTIVAVTIGGMVPLMLRRLKQDPALASGPILTTLTDMCGFFAVLGAAAHFISWLT